jgi:SAM-dependent methyltransferase
MFFRERATQAEYFDLAGRPQAEVTESYQSLASVNRFFLFAEPFQRFIPKLLGVERCRSLSILDLGAGDGSLGRLLADWAARKWSWHWRFTNLDSSIPALRLNASNCNVAASVLALPFRDDSFDLVIASQMTHHLNGDATVIRHLREAWRVARGGICFTDLHRGVFLYSMLSLLFRVRRFPNHFREDALLSVKRGFRTGELRELALQAKIHRASVSLYFGTRVILQAKKF